jgi:hypothetical protein
MGGRMGPFFPQKTKVNKRNKGTRKRENLFIKE